MKERGDRFFMLDRDRRQPLQIFYELIERLLREAVGRDIIRRGDQRSGLDRE
jgi:hypothetical protein